MKNIHKNTIKYLTYLVLNKRKLENKQAIVTLPWTKGLKCNTGAHLLERHKTSYYNTVRCV